MRSLYKGIIGFGLVAIPVQVYKAMDEERVELHWVHTVCGHRIHYRKFCSQCHRDVTAEELAKSAPLPDGRYVVVPAEEPAPAASDHTITILSFHSLTEIDPVFYRQAYWLEPGAGGRKAYRLLTGTMRAAGKVALGEMTLRSRRRMTVLRPYEETALMLHQMYFPESLRRDGAQFGQGPAAISDREREMAETLIAQMSEPFVPQNYPNAARQRLLETIAGLTPSAVRADAGKPVAEVIDLMEQLKASIAGSPRRGAS
ncbi:MAG: Ku domain-containing protein [Thermaerobacter sp.]|nr:Ku domain-containing protein [Thermaerobacter sp.]